MPHVDNYERRTYKRKDKAKVALCGMFLIPRDGQYGKKRPHTSKKRRKNEGISQNRYRKGPRNESGQLLHI